MSDSAAAYRGRLRSAVAVVLAAAWIGWTRFTSHRTPAAPAGAAAIPQE